MGELKAESGKRKAESPEGKGACFQHRGEGGLPLASRLLSPGDIRALPDVEKDSYFRSLETDEERDAFNDALVDPRKNHWDGVHSERTDTRRRRNHKNELPIMPDMIPALSSIDEHELQQMLWRLAQEGLSKRQQQVWYLCSYIGYYQREVADILGVNQPAISRALSRAEFALMRRAQEDGVALHLLHESGRRGYFAPGHRPEVPELVQEHRRLIEIEDGVITVIIDMDKKCVEIWDTSKPDVIRDNRRMPDGRVGFRTAIRKVESGKRKAESAEGKAPGGEF